MGASPPVLAGDGAPDSSISLHRGGGLTWQCFVSAGQRYQVDPMLLYAIAHVESGLNPHATNRNRDGSVDYGVMQVNSTHLPRLKRHGIDEKRLLAEPCLAVHTGASILADMIGRHGYTWLAVGAYNAGSGSRRSEARQRYVMKVWRRYTVVSAAGSGETMPASLPVAVSQKVPTSVEMFRWGGEEDRSARQ